MRWIIEKAREFRRVGIYLCFFDYTKAFDYVDHNKLWKILKEMGIPDHLTYFLRNQYVGQETTFRTTRGTIDWFQFGKGVCQGCIWSLCLFNLYAGHINQNAGLGWMTSWNQSCLENPHGQKNLAGYNPCRHNELDMTEWLSTQYYA